MMTRKDVLALLGSAWDEMCSHMKDSLGSDIVLLSDINGSLLSNSGKMLRPMVSLLLSKLCSGGAVTVDSTRLAAACELLHNATLMHDDVADNSTSRRGRPTLLSLLGPSRAVLVGDFWLARTLSLILSCRRKDEVLRLFAATLTSLAEGEMLQLEKADSGDTTEEEYFKVIYCKTACLFEVAGKLAALSVDADEVKTRACLDYARNLGIAFQIRDDILDYAGDGGLGKPLGMDIRERKITLPLLGALKGSAREEEMRARISSLAEGDEALCGEIAGFVLDNGGVEYASGVLQAYIDKAVSALDVFPCCPEREALSDIALYNSLRKV